MAGEVDEAAALKQAREFAGLNGLDLAQVVTTEKSLRWDAGSWQLGAGFSSLPNGERFKVVAYDFGAKRNILRMLVDRGCELTVVPAKTPPVKYSPSTPMVCFSPTALATQHPAITLSALLKRS